MVGELLDDIRKFLQTQIDANTYDVIITIERTGHRLFTLCLHNGLKCNIPIIPFRVVAKDDVTNKRIMLFDDKLHTGKHILSTKKSLNGYGALSIHTIVYAVSSGKEIKVDKYCKVLSKNEQESYRDSISKIMENLPYPYYTDHFYVKGKIDKPISKKTLMKSLYGLGEAYEVPITSPDATIKLLKISLNDPPTSLSMSNNEDYDIEKDIWKVRLFLLNDTYITIVPFAIPSITPYTDKPKGHSFPHCICQDNKDNLLLVKTKNPQWSLANYCIIFNYACNILQLFLKQWVSTLNQMDYDLEITEISNEYAKNIFKDAKMANYLTNLLEDYMNE